MNGTAIIRSTQQFGALRIDHDAHEVSLDGQPLHLTSSEFLLLTTLAEFPRRAFSNESLAQILTRSDWVNENHALQATVSRLRRKLGESGRHPKRVINVHGYGYRFEPDKGPDLTAAMVVDSQPSPPDLSPLSAFALLGLDRSILWASGSFTLLLDWQISDLQGTVLYDLMHPDDRPHAMAAREDLDAGLPTAFFLHLRNAIGEYRLVEALARPIVDSCGAIICFLGEFRPATMAQRTELANPD